MFPQILLGYIHHHHHHQSRESHWRCVQDPLELSVPVRLLRRWTWDKGVSDGLSIRGVGENEMEHVDVVRVVDASFSKEANTPADESCDLLTFVEQNVLPQSRSVADRLLARETLTLTNTKPLTRMEDFFYHRGRKMEPRGTKVCNII